MNPNTNYKILVENSPFGIEILNSEGVIIDMNSSLQRILGIVNPAQLIHKFSIFKDRNVPEEVITKLMQGETVHYESDFNFDIVKEMNSYETTKSGIIYINYVIIPLINKAQKKAENYLVYVIDITKRRKAREALRKKDRQLVESQEVAKLGSWDLNMILQKLDWSEQTYSLFDKDPQKFTPTFDEFARLIHPDDLEDMRTRFNNALKSDDSPYEGAIRIINDSGREWVMEAFGKVRRDANGKALNMFGTAQDITERIRIESALIISKDKLEERVNARTAELAAAEKNLKIQAKELIESNVALKVLLKQRDNDKNDFENNILSNIKHLVQPYIAKLKRNRAMSDELSYLNIIESNLKEIVSPFSNKLSFQYRNFTLREIMIADLIKDGKQDKDIVEILNISLDTIKTHRKNMRKKLGIYGKRTNLRVKLMSLID